MFGAWSAGGDTVKSHQYTAGAGTQAAGMVIAGYGYFGELLKTEKYDGTSFSDGGDLNATGRMTHGAFGAQDACACMGGLYPGPIRKKSSETYDGSTWSFAGDMSITRIYFGGTGTQTAGLAIGSEDGTYPTSQSTSEEFDGSVWSAGGDLVSSRGYGAYAGTQTAAVIFGGRYQSSGSHYVSTTEEYDGASWSTVSGGDIPSNRTAFAGCGTQSNALIFGGWLSDASGTTQTYLWDGSSFSSDSDLVAATYAHGGAGTTSAGLKLGGSSAYQYRCEEYNELPPLIKSSQILSQVEWTEATRIKSSQILSQVEHSIYDRLTIYQLCSQVEYDGVSAQINQPRIWVCM